MAREYPTVGQRPSGVNRGGFEPPLGYFEPNDKPINVIRRVER